MPIEIKELLIRAFVGDQNKQDEKPEDPQQKQVNTLMDSVAVIANMLKQEKER